MDSPLQQLGQDFGRRRYCLGRAISAFEWTAPAFSGFVLGRETAPHRPYRPGTSPRACGRGFGFSATSSRSRSGRGIKGPRASPAERVAWGEEGLRSGVQFSPEAETEQSGFRPDDMCRMTPAAEALVGLPHSADLAEMPRKFFLRHPQRLRSI